MAIVKRSRTTQYPLIAEYVFNFNDGVTPLASLTGPSVDTKPGAGVTDFGSKASPAGLLSGQTWTSSGSGPVIWEMFALPAGAQIIGGDVQIENPYAGPSSVTLAIGDSQAANRYFTAATVMATAFTNQPTTLTNNGTDKTVCTMGNATANGVSAVGQVITVSGCTGASAAYNGTFVVDTYSATQVTFTNPRLTTSLTLAGTIAATYSPVRAALLIPAEITYGGADNPAAAATGLDMRATLTFGNSTAATAGRVRVKVMYTIDGRGNEVSAA
jgi:hypothetical protein